MNWGGSLVNRACAVKHYHKTEKNWKGGMKYFRKEKKMIYSMTKKSGSHHDIKNIKKIHKKASKKCSYSSSDVYSSDSVFYFSLSIDI